jgi:hypothetical protein
MRKILIGSLITTSLFSSFLIFANSNNDLADKFASQTHDLKPQVVQLALNAQDNAEKKGLVHNKQYVTVIDYSLPSTDKRLWVLDLKNQKVVYNTYVAHGKNSGQNYATQFSNDPRSKESSIGVYVTEGTYSGHHGNSLRLEGLDKGYNSNAESRGIVMHSADYVDENIIENYGRLGTSWGCPALNPQIAQPIINTIKGGSVILAYYPDQNWLKHSQYLQG